MILKASQRGGASQLARHLMNDLDNDHISIHGMRGFVADDLLGAFKEIEAISKGTRCRQYLFSLSLNPPQHAQVSKVDFLQAIDDIEAKLNLKGQPRAIIFHEKNGRRHAHLVVSRIDASQMKSINLPHFKSKLQDVARDLYRRHGWEMPEGLKAKQNHDPLSYGLVECAQAKRVKRDPKRIKEIFQQCWAQSDCKDSFAHALAEQGYILAKGDRRGFVAVDRNGEIYSVARWVGIKTKELRARLGSPQGLPCTEDALNRFVSHTDAEIDLSLETQADKIRDDLLAFTAARLDLVENQRSARTILREKQRRELVAVYKAQPNPSNSGLKVLWNRLSGHEQKQYAAYQATRDALLAAQRDETQHLIQSQLKERRQLQQRYLQLQHHNEIAVRHLWRSLGFEEVYQNNDRVRDEPSFCVSDPAQHLVLNNDVDNSVAARVRRHPPAIIDVITQHKEFFSRNDIVSGLARYFDDPTQLYLAIENTLQSDQLIDIGSDKKLRYTTRELVTTKTTLHADSEALSSNQHRHIDKKYITAALKHQNRKLQLSVGAQLSAEQETAIRHVTDSSQLSLVTGYAGAGKSTMLEAAKNAWQKSGLNVIGAALSGKAADGLETSSGIQSRTLASLKKSWEGGYSLLTSNDVLVIDEAGMVGMRQMARIVAEIKKRGAKLVLVGDAQQLQPIAAGTPFAELEQVMNSAKLSEIRRQEQGWQCEASKLLATQNTTEAIQRYEEKGFVKISAGVTEAISALVEDYMNDVTSRGKTRSRLALAHRRKDVHLINQSIRAAHTDAGLLAEEIKIQTDNGPREFAVGDRIVLTKNDRDLAVRNGMLGTVTAIADGKLEIKIDDDKEASRSISLNPNIYRSIEHGYATTIHKSQGATVDKSFVLGSQTMDKHLTYVALTRHRENTTFYLDNSTAMRFRPAQSRTENKNALRRHVQSQPDW